MDKQFKFTDARIRALPANPTSASSTDLEVSDTEITGLKCLSGKTGKKRFLLRYVIEGRKRSIGLGRFPEVDVATARNAAQRCRRMLAQGQGPKDEQLAAKQRPTVSAFSWDTFFPLQKKHKKSWGGDAQRFRGDFEERLWKEIGNSLYGKLAQGLRGKTAFDISQGISSKIKPSKITNPYFASHVTGFARALMSEMLNGVPKGRTVVSVTTDGFLTNARPDEIDLTGPMCARFRALYRSVDPEGGKILELKHKAKQLIAMKTRGRLTAVVDPNFDPVIAKAGVQVPKDVSDERAFMLDLYLNRVPGQKLAQSVLTSTREQMLRNRDMVMETSELRLNLEPDFKRMLIRPRMVQVAGTRHIAFESAPHRNLAEAKYHRELMDSWRVDHVLKTMADWDDFSEFIEIQRIAKSTPELRIKKGERADGLFLRLFIRAYTQEQLGLERSMSIPEVVEYFGKHGYQLKASQLGSAKRAKLILGAVPKVASTLKLLEIILEAFPGFDYEPMFIRGASLKAEGGECVNRILSDTFE